MKLPALKKNQARGKTVLMRVDFNEPLVGGKLEDSFRIRKTAPTIASLAREGAKVILVAHLEDSNGKALSFAPVVPELSRILGQKIAFVKSLKEIQKDAVPEGITLIDNIRFEKGEEKNEAALAKRLAGLADMYVNEAFSVSHRKHASIVGVPRYLPSYAGSLFAEEVSKLSEALKPAHPFLLIVGGAKFKTKFALLKGFMKRADAVFLGGVLANTFLAAQNIFIGKSKYEREALMTIKKHFSASQKILLPIDVRLVNSEESQSVFSLGEEDGIYDVGEESAKMLAELAGMSRYVLWNGPLGFTEGGYDKSTKYLLEKLSRLKKTKVILGGGDTLAVLDEMKAGLAFYHVSTGGGAMLDFLADGSLPGIDALLKSKKK